MILRITFFIVMVLVIKPLNAQNQNNNIFLPSKFLSFQTFVPVDSDENGGIVKQIDKRTLNDIVFDKILKAKVNAYELNNFDEYFPYDCKVIDTLTVDDIKQKLISSRMDFKPDMKEVKYYNFVEEWIYDTSVFVFEKKVIAYQPVREYKTEPDDPYNLVRKILFSILNSETTNQTGMIPLMQVKPRFYFEIPDNMQKFANIEGIEILANEGIYFESKLTPYWNSDLRRKLTNSLFNRVLSNSIPVFDSDDGSFVSRSKVKTRLGIKMDTILINDSETGDLIEKQMLRELDPLEIKSISFVENWFINPENLSFRKEVEAIVPFRNYYKNWDDSVKVEEPVGIIYFDLENQDRIEFIFKQLSDCHDFDDCIDGIELLTNLFNQSKSTSFRNLCFQKQLVLIENLRRKNQGNEQKLVLIQNIKKIKV